MTSTVPFVSNGAAQNGNGNGNGIVKTTTNGMSLSLIHI